METMRRAFIGGSVAVAVMVASSSPAFAGPWSQPSGSGSYFTYANGGDLNGHFGDPYFFGDTFYFPNPNFQVNAANGQTDTESDILSFDVTTNPGYWLDPITITAYGTNAVVGQGSQVNFEATLTLHENGGLGRTWSGALGSYPSFPIYGNDSGPIEGSWECAAAISVGAVLPMPDASIHVSFSSTISAIAGATGSAAMNLQYQEASFALLWPEPASLTLLTTGTVLLVRRRC
jgi:hypothetical protein